MAWYRAGTVSINNGETTVTGAGTDFAANSRVGDAFKGPDGHIYEITNVASPTVISILPEYEGANAVGEGYAIIPVQGYSKNLADEASQLVNEFGNIPQQIDDLNESIDDLNESIDDLEENKANTSDLGTAAGFDAVESGSDTTADRLLKVGASGAQLGDDVYRRANIVGTVSEAGGTPTGAVIQRGSNSNGEFTRYADGTMICQRYWEETLSVNVANGSLYMSENITISYPSEFFNMPSFLPSAHVTNSTQISTISWRSIGFNAGIFKAVCPSVRENILHRLSYVAIGRWF